MQWQHSPARKPTYVAIYNIQLTVPKRPAAPSLLNRIALRHAAGRRR
jgi:hypothetical protein